MHIIIYIIRAYYDIDEIKTTEGDNMKSAKSAKNKQTKNKKVTFKQMLLLFSIMVIADGIGIWHLWSHEITSQIVIFKVGLLLLFIIKCIQIHIQQKAETHATN